MGSLSRFLLSAVGVVLLLAGHRFVAMQSTNELTQKPLNAGKQSLPDSTSTRLRMGNFDMEQSEAFVLAQPLGGCGGLSGFPAPPTSDGREVVPNDWVKPDSPAPKWLDDSIDAEARERDLAVHNALDERIDVDFNNTPFASVAQTLSDTLGIAIIIDDKALEEESVTPEEPISATRKSTRVRDILRQILEPFYLTFKVEREALYITNKKSSANVVQCFDLSYVFPDNTSMLDLIRAIENVVRPDSWSNAGGTSNMATVGSVLIVNAPQDTQDDVAALLREIRRQSPANMKPLLLKDKPAEKATDKP